MAGSSHPFKPPQILLKLNRAYSISFVLDMFHHNGKLLHCYAISLGSNPDKYDGIIF